MTTPHLRKSPLTSFLTMALLGALLTGYISATSGDAGATGSARPVTPELSVTATEHFVAESTRLRVERVPYPTADGGDPTQNWGDLYLPAGRHTADSVPLAVLIHGGSWKDNLSATSMDNLARDLSDRGMAVYNIEYRRIGSGGGWPTTFTDVDSALAHVVELAQLHPQLDLNEVVVAGYSAGAQLGTWAATHPPQVGEPGQLIRPERVVSISGPLDMRYSTNVGSQTIPTALGGTPMEVSERYAQVSPIENLNPDIPVTAFHGTDDAHVPAENSQRYIARLEQLGGEGTLVLAHGEDHVSLMKKGSPWYGQILEAIAAGTTDAA